MFGSGVPAAIQSRNTEFNLTTSAFSGSITHRGGTEITKKEHHLGHTISYVLRLFQMNKGQYSCLVGHILQLNFYCSILVMPS